MATIKNPFIITGEIPDKYFCDREKESEWLITSVTNGNNVVLMSPRRMGKTSLVEHCYRSHDISKNYYTFYIDILPTTSLAEFVSFLSKKVYETLVPKGKKVLDRFFGMVSSLRGCLGYDPLSGMPTFTVSGGHIQHPSLTLGEIFSYLAEADKPCIMTIDEFQQINKYPEKNVEALLRSHIQKISNCNFVFSGSERHLMMQMFNDSSRPFYNSATLIDLRAIPEKTFADFIMRNFENFGKHITEENAIFIYRELQGNTFYIQRLCNASFSHTPVGKECDTAIIRESLEMLLEMNESYFRERLSLVSAKQKPLLYAISKEGEVEGILSAKFINNHNLGTASATQHAAKQLVDNGLLNLCDGVYTLSDKFLRLWITRNLL